LVWLLNHKRTSDNIYREWPNPYYGNPSTLVAILGSDTYGWRLNFSACTDAEAHNNAIFEILSISANVKALLYAPSFEDEAIQLAESRNVTLINLLNYLRLTSLLANASNEDVDKIAANFDKLFDEPGLLNVSSKWDLLLEK
jgi:hypothetical protein